MTSRNNMLSLPVATNAASNKRFSVKAPANGSHLVIFFNIRMILIVSRRIGIRTQGNAYSLPHQESACEYSSLINQGI